MDEYGEIAEVYYALNTPEVMAGECIENPDISEFIANLPDGSHILDAACGLGDDAIAIQNSLPKEQTAQGKKFFAYGADFSQAMIDGSKQNAATFFKNDKEIDFRCCSFEDLKLQQDWYQKFDAVIVPNALYTFPKQISAKDYELYFQRCLESFSCVLKKGGFLVANFRDWQKIEKKNAKTSHEDERFGEVFITQYEWLYNQEDGMAHYADIIVFKKDNPDKRHISSVKYYNGTALDFADMIEKAGFKIDKNSINKPSAYDEGFVTLIAERI